MAKRRKINTGDELEASFELDLAPMLALMVTLIPIMLLSTVFVKVSVIDTPLPQVVQKAIHEDKKKSNSVEFSLHMDDKSGFQIKVTKSGRTLNRVRIPKAGAQWDLNKLHGEAVKLKQQYPRKFRMDLLPTESVPYVEIVKVMDALRSTNDKDPKLFIKDEESKRNVETDVLFPDVVFSNVLEG